VCVLSVSCCHPVPLVRGVCAVSSLHAQTSQTVLKLAQTFCSVHVCPAPVGCVCCF